MEVSLLARFADGDDVGHWVTHLLVAATVALLALSFWVRRSERSAPHPVLAVVAAHLPAAVPGLLVGAGVREAWWMDVFLGSVSAHYTPTGKLTWAVLAVVACVTYTRARPWPSQARRVPRTPGSRRRR